MLDVADMEAARERLTPYVVRTPLLNSPRLDRELGGEIYVKPESLQKTGSFKFRGALNKILQLSEPQLQRGVVAYSSGNHGVAVAAAAALAGAPATIVLPNTAPSVKVESCRWWGAETILYDPASQRREDIAQEQIDKRGRSLVPPFDDYAIIAGQSSIGGEICEQLAELGKKPDAVVTGCSGGGLASGVFSAVRHAHPKVECAVVEPHGYAKMARSFEVGAPSGNAHEARTVMDSLSGRLVGARTFEILQRLQAKPVAVSEEEAVAGVCAGFQFFRLVLEAGGAAALAAVMNGRVDLSGRCVVVVCSGGNVDRGAFADMLGRSPVCA